MKASNSQQTLKKKLGATSSRKSFGVVAREKSVQTPLSFIFAKQTRIYMESKNADMFDKERGSIIQQLKCEVD